MFCLMSALSRRSTAVVTGVAGLWLASGLFAITAFAQSFVPPQRQFLVRPAQPSPAARPRDPRPIRQRPSVATPTPPVSPPSREPWLVRDEVVARWAAAPLFPRVTAGESPLSPADRGELDRAIETALQSALPPDRVATEAEQLHAREALARVQARVTADSRLHYAVGLVALAAGDWAGAEEAFALAIEQSPETHLGAHAGQVYAALARGDQARATELCRGFARTLGTPASQWAGAELLGGSAAWLGRAVATVSAPADDSLQAEIVDRLPTGLQPTFRESYAAVVSRRALMLRWSRLGTAQLHAETTAIRTEIGDQLETLTATERTLLETRQRLRKDHAEAIRTTSTPLVHKAHQLQVEGLAARRTFAALVELEQGQSPLSPTPPPFFTFARAPVLAFLEPAGYRTSQPGEGSALPWDRQAAVTTQLLAQQRESLRERRERMAQLAAELESGRSQRQRLEADHHARLQGLEDELAGTRKTKIGVVARLKDLRGVVAHPARLRERTAAPATWLPLNLAAQLEALTQTRQPVE